MKMMHGHGDGGTMCRSRTCMLLLVTMAVLVWMHATAAAATSRTSSPANRLRQRIRANDATSIEESDDLTLPSSSSLLEVRSGSSLPQDWYSGPASSPNLRSPYLPTTLSGPIYSKAGPQSGVAQAWSTKGSAPSWAALPFGPRAHASPYILPFDHMREVQDEFSWNYEPSDSNQAAKIQPQFTFAAPIFLESKSEQHVMSEADNENEAENENETDVESESGSEADVETDGQEAADDGMVVALEVDSLENALRSGSDSIHDSTFFESASASSAAASSFSSVSSGDIPPEFWAARAPSPSFNSYSYPYFDLTNPSSRGANLDGLANAHAAASAAAAMSGTPVAHPHAFAYADQASGLPPFAAQIEPWAQQAPPYHVSVGENPELETFLSEIEKDAQIMHHEEPILQQQEEESETVEE